ncbi:uncharacterized protein J4E79_011654 [Alternaria viburni]|uniref:uncharacterized protein n=1 Tax=Alternaria viburni TaxID=566460 RepID=UPI0020C3A479|nr:uncharacterized protein J4E79_011654 [Alternaria viburni]KAI4641447.1 hypothetical protein J4E79_011654 [Alternaria viburni]
MKRFTNPELECLGLSRTDLDSGPFPDQEQEDAFALRARWWPSLKFYERHTRDEPYPYGHHFPSDLHVAYTPTGSGIWVLAVWAENSQTWLEEYDPPRRPEDWVDLAYCRTMEERCKILEEFGATFYEDVEQCDKLPWSLDEGIRKGKRYEKLLRKMEDDEYFEDWMNSL